MLHLTRMVLTFLTLMRHQNVIWTSDSELVLKAVMAVVKEQCEHCVLVDERPLHS